MVKDEGFEANVMGSIPGVLLLYFSFKYFPNPACLNAQRPPYAPNLILGIHHHVDSAPQDWRHTMNHQKKDALDQAQDPWAIIPGLSQNWKHPPKLLIIPGPIPILFYFPYFIICLNYLFYKINFLLLLNHKIRKLQKILGLVFFHKNIYLH